MAKRIYATLAEAREAAARRHLLPAVFALVAQGWCIVQPQLDDPPVPPMVICDFSEDDWDAWASQIAAQTASTPPGEGQ